MLGPTDGRGGTGADLSADPRLRVLLDLAGWHGAEAGVRWTDDDAALDLPAAAGADSFLEVEVVGSMLCRQDHVPIPTRGAALLAA